MITLISDIHGNLEALEEILHRARGEIFCCGDFVGYGPNPNEVIELCREKGVKGVLGNHDHAVLHEPRGFNIYAEKAIRWTTSVLTEENMQFLKDLSFNIVTERKNKTISIYHGSPRSITRYIYANYPDSYFTPFLKETDVMVLGHTHVPMEKRIDKKLVLNPGAVGQPRDNDPRASMFLFDPAKMTCQKKRIVYNIDAVKKKIIKNKLPDFLWKRLYSGI